VGRFKGGIVLKDHDGSVVKALGGWVVKSYRPKNARAAWHFAIRPSRARRAFLLGRELRDLGIPTPPPVAWQVRRRAGLLQSEIFIMAEAPAAETMSDWLKRDVREPALRARVMAAYGRLLAQFHRRGYSNRDMKHSNIMCGRAEPWQLQVVDLDGVRHWPWLGRRRAGRDLMRVGQSLASLGWTGPAEVRAFFEAYNAEAPARLRRDAFPPERK
jgi:tRNA A-37 threonylcarbamoyl transferase component Bud32